MGDRLDIGHLRVCIRSDEAACAQQFAARMQALGTRALPRALEGCAARALAHAGLPAAAVVAVRRLELHLRADDGVQNTELATGWAAAVEAALTRLLSGLAPGDDADGAPAVWFGDPWAAERRHLERRAAGAPDAWWSGLLLTGDDAPGTLEPSAILERWLRRAPGRAVAEMATAVHAEPRLARLLEPAQALRLAHLLIARGAGRRDTADPAGGARQKTVPATTTAADPVPPALCDEYLDTLRACLRTQRARLAAFAAATQCAPWLAALLLAAHPSARRVGAAGLQALIRDVQDAPAGAAGTGPAAAATGAAAPAPAHDPARRPVTGAVAAVAADAGHRVHAGGLLLLLRPLARLPLFERGADPGRAAGELALLALHRVLAPLAPAARRAAFERERPLLAVFAPECDWQAPIADAPVRAPGTASELLDRLADAIPPAIGFAPGALREIFGMHAPAYADAAGHRLACLLLRPGVLRTRPWEAEIEWPLVAVDLALRRAGWDQDPGWVPWIGRTIRLRYGAEA